MSALTLYGAADELRSLFDTLEGLEDPQAIAEFEKQMEPAFERALAEVESFHAFVAKLDADAAACKVELDRLQKRKKSLEAQAERLRDYAIRSMRATGITRIEAPTVTLALRDNPESVVIENESLIPPDLVWVRPKITAQVWYYIKRKSHKDEEFAKDVGEGIWLADQNLSTEPAKAEIKRLLLAGETVPGARLERGQRLVVK